VSKNPQTVKTQVINGLGILCTYGLKEKKVFKIFAEEKLASQGVLTCCANGWTTVPLYANAARWAAFVFQI
jgi:hypothetical protein